MLVLTAFLAIGVFSVAFLLCFLSALHSESRVEKAREERTKQIAGSRIAIAEVRKPTRGIVVTCSNPGLMRRAGPTTGGITLVASESSGIKREA